MASRLTKPIRWLLADNTSTRNVPTIDPITAWLRDDTSSSNTASSIRVTQDTSLSIGAVFACVSLISDTVSMLPIDTYVKDGEYRRPAPTRPDWLDYPDSDGLTWMSFAQQWVVSKLISHGACVRILRDEFGDTIAFRVLDPRRVNPDRTKDGRLFYDYNGERGIPASEMIYDSALIRPGQIKGVSRIDELREMFGLAKALEQFSSRFFGQGSTTSGVIEFPGEGDKALALQIQDSFEEGHKGLRNAHRPSIIFGGGKFTKTGVDPEEAQMLGSREFSTEEVARAFRVHPALIQVTKPGTQAYASREQDAIQYTTFTLMSYITPIEQHLNRLLPRQEFVKINVNALLRASLADRFAAYNQGVQGGFISNNRIASYEDWEPVEGGDELRVPLANINLSAANLVETQKRVDMFKTLTDAGLTADSAASIVGLPSVTITATPSEGTAA